MNGESSDNRDQGQSFVAGISPHSSAIVSLTNPQKDLDNMEMTFRSSKIDKRGEMVRFGQPLLNEEGINAVRGQIQSIVSRLTILSNINKNEVENLMEYLADVLAQDLMIHRVKYGIKDGRSRTQVYVIALTTAFICLKRGFEEGDKKFWKGSVQEFKSTSESVGQRGNSGLLGRFNPFGR